MFSTFGKEVPSFLYQFHCGIGQMPVLGTGREKTYVTVTVHFPDILWVLRKKRNFCQCNFWPIMHANWLPCIPAWMNTITWVLLTSRSPLKIYHFKILQPSPPLILLSEIFLCRKCTWNRAAGENLTFVPHFPNQFQGLENGKEINEIVIFSYFLHFIVNF